MDTATEIHATDPNSYHDVDMRDIVNQLAALTESHNRILEMLTTIERNITPTLEAMKSSPIGKIMGM